ncbi:TerB family tellurite resistance protein [Geminocystis sp. CENA526]|uniref:tellurite resistance TerB family protein n=1 Tax=Geminocystis sp. CENA526 TaxID=1355871 RepID=UPI003D6F23AB
MLHPSILSPIISLIQNFIIGIIKLLSEVLISAVLWKFVQSRITKIPRYIRLLLYIYTSEKPESKVHQQITITLLILSTILSSIAGNFLIIGIPIIREITVAVSLLVTLSIILATMEIIIRQCGDDYFKSVKDINIKEDIQEIEKLLGAAWNKLIEQLETLYTILLPTIEKEFKSISEEIESYFKPNLQDLYIYINTTQGTEIVFSKSSLKKIGNSLEAWQKSLRSVLQGSVAGSAVGLGVSSVASSIFVPSTIWTSLASILGIHTGVAVSASAFTMLTVGLPVTLAVTTAGGAMYWSFKNMSNNEKNRESQFFANSIIATIPMGYADGYFCEKEKDVIDQLTNNNRIIQEDHDRIYKAIETNKYKSFNQVCKDNLFLKTGDSNAEIQHTLLLYQAWELAKVDGIIHPKEIELFERMAGILKIKPEVARNIQGMLTPEFTIKKRRYDTPFNLNKDYIPLISLMDDFIYS